MVDRNTENFTPKHLFPVESTSYPKLQMHLYVPRRFSQLPLGQMSGFSAHSLISIERANLIVSFLSRLARKAYFSEHFLVRPMSAV